MSFLSEPLQNILIRPKRMIGDIAVQVVVNEQTTDTLTITKQPVQQGASITDHAYLEPTTFSHTIYFKSPDLIGSLSGLFGGGGATSLKDIYDQLLELQSGAIPFDIVTPKRIYHNMLMAALTMTTDKLTENNLAIHATYQQIILVPILAANVPRLSQKNPASTGGTLAGGAKSVILKTVGSPFSSFFGG